MKSMMSATASKLPRMGLVAVTILLLLLVTAGVAMAAVPGSITAVWCTVSPNASNLICNPDFKTLNSSGQPQYWVADSGSTITVKSAAPAAAPNSPDAPFCNDCPTGSVQINGTTNAGAYQCLVLDHTVTKQATWTLQADLSVDPSSGSATSNVVANFYASNDCTGPSLKTLKFNPAEPNSYNTTLTTHRVILPEASSPVGFTSIKVHLIANGDSGATLKSCLRNLVLFAGGPTAITLKVLGARSLSAGSAALAGSLALLAIGWVFLRRK